MSVTAVITGASQGIGAAIAVAFARQPEARLFLLARNAAALAEIAARCTAEGAHAEAIVCDVTNAAAVDVVANDLNERGEAIDLLLNNAGRFVQEDLFATSPEQFRDCLETNLVSAFLVTRAFVPAMVQRKHGTIMFMASVASTQAYPRAAAYCAAKHGLLGLARSVRQATTEANLRVTTIMPGATDSPSWSSSDVAKERMMPAEDIARSVVAIYELSDRSVVEEIILRPTSGDV